MMKKVAHCRCRCSSISISPKKQQDLFGAKSSSAPCGDDRADDVAVIHCLKTLPKKFAARLTKRLRK